MCHLDKAFRIRCPKNVNFLVFLGTHLPRKILHPRKILNGIDKNVHHRGCPNSSCHWGGSHDHRPMVTMGVTSKAREGATGTVPTPDPREPPPSIRVPISSQVTSRALRALRAPSLPPPRLRPNTYRVESMGRAPNLPRPR